MPTATAPAAAKPRNPELVARDARCADWIRDLFLYAPTPGRLTAADLARHTDHTGWRKAWTKRGIDATISGLCDGGPDGDAALLRREDDGSWTMPCIVVLHDAGMI